MELGVMGQPPDTHRDILKELNIKHCGLSIDLSEPDGMKTAMDSLTQIRKLGLEPLGTIPIGHRFSDVMFYHDFGRECRQIAREGICARYEIWPEPACQYISNRNKPGLFGMRDYVTVIKCAYENLKEIDPRIEVWNGGMGQHGTCWSLQRFLWDALDYIDVVNLHPFQFDGNWHRVIELISGLLAKAMLFMRDAGKERPICVSEWGYPTARMQTVYGSFLDQGGVEGVREEQQVSIVEEVLTMCEPIIDEFFFAFIQDVGGSHWGGHTGLLREDGTKKPVYDLVKAWANTQRRGTVKWNTHLMDWRTTALSA